MSGFVLTKEAHADLRKLQRESVERFGKERTKRYVTVLDEAFRRVAAHPTRHGLDVSEMREGYRRARCGRHAFYYVMRDDGILVVRILHERQLPERHL